MLWKTNKKLKAFTLSEMMVVLVITVIVVGLAFSVLSLVQKQMGNIAKNYEEKTATNLLRQALWIDFNTYHYVSFNKATNTLRCENELGNMDYVFNGDMLIRNTDTLDISITAKKMYFNGVEQSSGQVDGLLLLTAEEETPRSVFVYKNNAANTYIK